MKLYGSYTSPFVRQCRIALAEENFDFEFVETDQAGSAIQTPTQRVPFLEDGEVFLTDSSTILKYIREKSGKTFLQNVKEWDEYCLINTLMDTTANLFFLERDGVDLNAYAYTKRQSARIGSILEELNARPLPKLAPYSDAQLRLACYLDWADIRKRIKLDLYPNLIEFLDGAKNYSHFKNTAIPKT